jgi:hypothetical protein
MLLLTTIAPRRDGTVLVTGESGHRWAFAPDASGRLVCDVDDDALVQRLVRGGLFAPADGASLPPEEPEGEADEQDDDADDASAEDASAPVEANTPPATIPGTRPRGRARKQS